MISNDSIQIGLKGLVASTMLLWAFLLYLAVWVVRRFEELERKPPPEAPPEEQKDAWKGGNCVTRIDSKRPRNNEFNDLQ